MEVNENAGELVRQRADESEYESLYDGMDEVESENVDWCVMEGDVAVILLKTQAYAQAQIRLS